MRRSRTTSPSAPDARVRHLRRALTLATALALVAGCGAQLDDAQRAALAANEAGATTTVVVDGPVAGDAPVAADGTASTVARGAPVVGGRTATTAPAVDSCRPQPVDEVGVTDTQITLGNISMVSGPIPGAGQTGIDGTRAYLEHINSQGGICGRKLKLITGDDRTDSGQNRIEAKRLSGQAFGLVGGASIVDSGTADAVEGTDVPVIQVAVADNSLRSRNIFSPAPLDPNGTTNGSIPYWRWYKRTTGLRRVGIVVVSLAAARARGQTYVSDLAAAGLEVAGVHEVSLAETNFVSVAQQLENEGADGVLGLLDPVGSARLAKAIDQIGFEPKVETYGNQNYGRPFLDLADGAAEGAIVALNHDIFENAANNPAVARFLEWFRRTAPGHTPDFYGAMGWASADMMVEALRAAGPAPTRAKVLAHLRQLTAFDAHGFLALCNPAGKVTAPTFVVAQVRDGQWRRVYPPTGFGDGT